MTTAPAEPRFRERVVARAAAGMARRPGRLAALALAVGAVFWFHLPRTAVRSDVDDFVLANDSARLFRLEMEKSFAKNDLFLIAFDAGDVFTARSLTVLKEITDAAAALDGVEEALSLSSVDDMAGTEDSFSVQKLFDAPPTDPAALKRLRRRVLANPLYIKNLVSADGRTAAVIVYPRDDAKAEELLGEVRKILAPHRAAGWTFHLAGGDVTSVGMAELTNKDVARFLPLVVLLALAVTYWLFRSVWLLALAGVGVLCALGATLGLSAAVRSPLSMTTVAVLPLVVTLAMSDLVHLFSHLDRRTLERAGSPRAALESVLRDILFPCFLTSVNTAIGFGSLAWNDIPAIRAFGLLAASGMFFEFLFTFGLIAPALLFLPARALWRDPVAHESRAIPRVVRAAHGLVARRPGAVFAVCLALLAAAGAAASRLRVETSAFEFFRVKEPLRRDLEFVRDRLAGIVQVDVSLQADERNAFRDPEQLRRLESLQAEIAALPDVDVALSLADYFKEMNKAFHAEDPAFRRLPATRSLVEQYLLLYSADDLAEFVDGAYRWTRLRVRFHHDQSERIQSFLRRLNEILGGPATEGWRVNVVGYGVEEVRAADSMIRSQAINIATAVGTIGLVMLAVLRSAGMVLLFLVPNLFPIVLNFGLMAMTGITINTGTILIAASAFGIIVDDTVHFFTRLQDVRARRPFHEALHRVTEEKGEAALSSAAILCAGFGVLLLGNYLPVVHYGVLNVVIMATGMVGDMFFLKSIFYIGRSTFFRDKETP